MNAMHDNRIDRYTIITTSGQSFTAIVDTTDAPCVDVRIEGSGEWVTCKTEDNVWTMLDEQDGEVLARYPSLEKLLLDMLKDLVSVEEQRDALVLADDTPATKEVTP